MSYLFSSESVSEGHPDKVADQISDALLDQFLAYDPTGALRHRELCHHRTGGHHGRGALGSLHRPADHRTPHHQPHRIHEVGISVRRQLLRHPDRHPRTERRHQPRRGPRQPDQQQGAGDQGMMFGYATNETENYMPVSLDLAHLIMKTLADIRNEGKQMTYLRPDAKSQVTVEYSDEGVPQRIDTIVVSTQHDEFDTDEAMLSRIKDDVINILIPRVKQQIHSQKVLDLFGLDINYLVNPTGKFVIGGPHGDTGLTGRKIIVDTYGGKGAHGGGAFSGKDSSKVDRSAAYMARYIAKNMVAAGVSDEMLVQLSYAIGVAQPVSIYVNTYGKSHVDKTDGEIAKKIEKLFDLRPKAIERSLKLRQPMYLETAAYGHMGRKNEVISKTFTSHYHETKTIDVNCSLGRNLTAWTASRKSLGLTNQQINL